MLVMEMSQRECVELLAHNRVARLACERDGQPIEPRALEPIYFRVSVVEMSGRRAEPP